MPAEIKKMRTYLYILIFTYILSPFISSAAGDGKKIHRKEYTDEELYHIIDSLMDVPKPDQFIIAQIKDYINTRKLYDKNIPGDEYYHQWDTKTIQPYNKEELTKLDSTVYLTFKDQYSNFYVPFNGPITSPYGWRQKEFHKGLDIDLKTGDKVVAAFDGMVRIAQSDRGYGRVVIIRHSNGLETTYAHLSKLKVKPGQEVKAGELIGLGGNTGRSTGSHLHFEIRYKGIPINPAYFISFDQDKLIAQDFVLKKSKSGYSAYPEGSKTYKIKRGDSLYIIAKHYGLTVKELKALNGIKKNTTLRIGQELRVG